MKKSTLLPMLTAALLLAACAGGLAGCRSASDQNEETDESVATTTAATVTRPETLTEPSTALGTEPATEAVTVTQPETDPETQPPPRLELAVDGSYSIVIPANADDLTRQAADMVASLFKEKAGLELEIAEGDEAVSHGIFLGTEAFDGERGFAVTVDGADLCLTASDSTTLYFAAEAVAGAWLDPAAGCVADGQVLLYDTTVSLLGGVTTRLDCSIRILTQNMRGTDDGNGNTVQARSERFMRMMAEYQPDLVGTQEYTFAWQTWLKKHYKKAGGSEETSAYGQVGCSRDGENTKGGEWNAILYRVDRFELLDSDTFWLSDTPDTPSVFGGLPDKRICTWAKLKDKKTGEIFVYANTHLDHTDDDIRYAQAEVLMAQLEGIAGDLPLYLTGDFNCDTFSSPYALVTETLRDTHPEAWTAVGGSYGTYHDYGQYGVEIDFIFHDRGGEPIRYEVVAKQYDGYVSDHYGVFAEFVQ